MRSESFEQAKREALEKLYAHINDVERRVEAHVRANGPLTSADKAEFEVLRKRAGEAVEALEGLVLDAEALRVLQELDGETVEEKS